VEVVTAASGPRRQRSLTETLLSIVLTLEAFVVFFLTLTVFGLGALEPAIAFSAGGVLLILFLVGSRVVRYTWGIWLGWVLQVVLLASGLILPINYFVAALFLGVWIYCVVVGGRIDRRNAASTVRPEEGEAQ